LAAIGPNGGDTEAGRSLTNGGRAEFRHQSSDTGERSDEADRTDAEEAGRFQTFHRVVKANPATVDDFKSYDELGRPPPRDFLGDPARLRSWQRVSVFDTEDGARRVARASRNMRLGRYIAQLRIPVDQPERFDLERTGSHGHYDVRASAADLLACVVRVVPV
jgi:hypothetical protein